MYEKLRTLTIYCCGTGSDERCHAKYLLPYLYSKAHDDIWHKSVLLNGPGTRKKNWFINVPRGMMFGLGVNSNVSRGKKQVAAKIDNELPQCINIIGWSRGAVTAIKIASELYEDNTTKHIPVHVFAIDPVAGGNPAAGISLAKVVGFAQGSIWQGIKITQNVKACTIVYAVNDTRTTFFPPVDPINEAPACVVKRILMLGTHSSIVSNWQGKEGIAEGENPAGMLVFHLAVEFLKAHGTQLLGGVNLLDKNSIEALYAQLLTDDVQQGYIAKTKRDTLPNPLRKHIRKTPPVRKLAYRKNAIHPREIEMGMNLELDERATYANIHHKGVVEGSWQVA